ncbi:hypothetical protein C8233_17985 [Halomonas sp. SF2003]|nr:hypothetical protein C8233_17985 [Halomonas sp. SF2003]
MGDDGNFEITLDPALEDDTELTATATDPAGNTSGPSNPAIVDTATDTTRRPKARIASPSAMVAMAS